jgi:hypothetical protein
MPLGRPHKPARDRTVRSRHANPRGSCCILPNRQPSLPILAGVWTLMVVVIDESRDVVRFAEL